MPHEGGARSTRVWFIKKKYWSSFFLLSSIIHRCSSGHHPQSSNSTVTNHPTEEPRHTGRNLLDWPRSKELAREVETSVYRTAMCNEWPLFLGTALSEESLVRVRPGSMPISYDDDSFSEASTVVQWALVFCVKFEHPISRSVPNTIRCTVQWNLI